MLISPDCTSASVEAYNSSHESGAMNMSRSEASPPASSPKPASIAVPGGFVRRIVQCGSRMKPGNGQCRNSRRSRRSSVRVRLSSSST